MSGRSDASTPSVTAHKRSMRHEEGADTIPETRGWLRKEGETLHNLYKRYMVLKGCTLSNHRNEDGPATWTVDMTQASVRTGPRKNEIVLSLPQKRISLFASDEADQARWIGAMKVAIAGGRSVDTHYKLGRMLGEGAFAQVRLAADRETGEHVAVKVIKKSEFAPQEMEYIRREVQVCRQVFHPNVIETRDIFDTSAELFIVLELLSGGELFDQIAEAGSFTEKQAAQVMREITKGVAYLHKNSICHGDLKVRLERRWWVPGFCEQWSWMVGSDGMAPSSVVLLVACAWISAGLSAWFRGVTAPDSMLCLHYPFFVAACTSRSSHGLYFVSYPITPHDGRLRSQRTSSPRARSGLWRLSSVTLGLPTLCRTTPLVRRNWRWRSRRRLRIRARPLATLAPPAMLRLRL